jgi:hypothetical protein
MSCGTKHIITDEYALKKSVKAYYSAKLNNDYETMYKYINPSSKKKVPLKEFIAEQKTWANIKIDDFYIGEVTYTDPKNALVEVIIVMKSGAVPTQFPFIFEEGGWYRRYPTY